MKSPSPTATGKLAIAAVILLCALSTGGEPATPKQNTAPATGQPPYGPCSFIGGSLVNIDNLVAEEKKVPNRFTFLVGDESLADGLLALISFAESGIAHNGFAINLLGQQLHAECQARVSDENTIIALQNQLKELQRQVSLLQKELRPKAAPKGDRP